MSFDALITQFAKQAPIATMVRGLMANILSPAEVNAIFRETAERQHESPLRFSTVVDLLSLVVSKAQPSLHAAYQTRRKQLTVSLAALYEKTARVEPPVTRELVRRTGQRMREVVAALEPDQVPLWSGYEVRIVDGSPLASTEHRIEETRELRGGLLPGQALMILDPQRNLIVDMIPCEDGHAQERSLFVELVEPFAPGQLWIADRNFCTRLVIHEAAVQKACFLVRQHAGLRVQEAGRWHSAGRTDGGRLFEQLATVADGYGNEVVVRRIRLVLDEPTEDGTREIYLLTNLPPKIAAGTVVELYHNRWSIERAFGELTLSLRGEIDTLGYPRAALLAYAIALVTYNLLAVVKAALRVAHGTEQVQDKVSFYYLANEVANTWHGMEIALSARGWNSRFADLSPRQLATQLKQIAGHAQLRRYRKHPRGPKKPIRKRRGTAPHVSTARLIARRRE
jgi:DDE family transposase